MRLRVVALLLLPVSFLASCAAPLTDRGKEHKVAIASLHEATKSFDLGAGDIEKVCAIPFDCSANDMFEYMAVYEDDSLDIDGFCAKFFDLAKALDFEYWRLDSMEPENLVNSESVDATLGEVACHKALSQNMGGEAWGQSEGVLFYGKMSGIGEPVNFVAQGNSYRKDDDKGFYFMITTMEDPCSVDCEDDGIS